MKLSAAIAVFMLTVCSLTMSAQTDSKSFDDYVRNKKAEFEAFRQRKMTEFEQYRQRLNEEYANLLNSRWSTFKEEPGMTPIMEPEPVKPIVADNDRAEKPRQVAIGRVVKPSPAIPDVPVTLPGSSSAGNTYPVNFRFFNTPCGIGNFDTALLSMAKTDNRSLTAAWRKLTDNERLTPLVNDCLRLREDMRLCDWGYLLLVEKVAATLYPKSTDCQAFLAVALLNQSGYDARLGLKDGRLVMMFHPSHTIYESPFLCIDGKAYYPRGANAKGNAPLSTYSGDYRKSPTPIRLTIDRYPRFSPPEAGTRTYSSATWKSAPPFEVTVNASVIEFFNAYPAVDWPVYGVAPMGPELSSVLLPVMRMLTEDMGEVEAVNMILSYLNYGFNYMTDGDQFGREKSFFFEENFYYPYNDCEDRAILFAKLVNSVLGLDVVYLKLPRHLACAVRFSPDTSITGSSVKVDGQTYYVCDPTCIGGKAGYLAAQFANSTPEVYKIKP